jgi:hypothetical protein
MVHNIIFHNRLHWHIAHLCQVPIQAREVLGIALVSLQERTRYHLV